MKSRSMASTGSVLSTWAGALALIALPPAATIWAPTAAAQPAFADVSAAAGVDRAGESYGASWGDLDGDGYLDIFASNHRTRPSLFLNRRDGTFFETGPQVLIWRNRSRADTHGGSWADLRQRRRPGSAGQFRHWQPEPVARQRACPAGRPNQRAWAHHRQRRWPPAGMARLQRRQTAGFRHDTVRRHRQTLQAGGGRRIHGNDGRREARLQEIPLRASVSRRTATGGWISCVLTKDCFPQKIYDTQPFPWKKLFDNTVPSDFFPTVEKVVDSVVADFNNDGRMDLFMLSGVQLRPASVVQSSATHVEAQLTGGTKGFKFVTPGQVTITPDWNKADEQSATDLSKIEIGAGALHPAPCLLRWIRPIGAWPACRRRPPIRRSCQSCRSATTRRRSNGPW